uniref:Uncharacterized protein n=1 Tax=Acrobeloides nanus TaxID=290746 RepID=A0A914BWS2_9BILA
MKISIVSLNHAIMAKFGAASRYNKIRVKDISIIIVDPMELMLLSDFVNFIEAEVITLGLSLIEANLMFRCHELVPKVFPPTRVIVHIKNQLQTWKLDIALFDAFITNSTNLRTISFAICDLDGAQVLNMVRYFYE